MKEIKRVNKKPVEKKKKEVKKEVVKKEPKKEALKKNTSKVELTREEKCQIVIKNLRIFLGIVIGSAIIVLLFVIFDRDTDHRKIDKLSIGCRILGEAHVLEEIAKEKDYYVYEQRMFSSYAAPALTKEVKGDKKYWAPRGWKLKGDTRSIVFDEDVRIISDKANLVGWKKIGKYIPSKGDRVFIYKLPPTSVSYGDRYIIGDYTVMYSGLEGIEYVGLLNEKNIEKLSSKLFINAVFTSDNSFNKNNLQYEK